MTYSTAAESKARNLLAMGKYLGEQYSALWQELALTYYKWNEYVGLFGTNKERVQLLNKASSTLFHLIQDELWDSVLLSISRIVDSPRSAGRTNLTLQNLPSLIEEPELKVEISSLLETARNDAAFCRDLRNRRLAHRDLASILNNPATPLVGASREQVNRALKSLERVLNRIQLHYFQSETHFDFHTADGAWQLLTVIYDGVCCEDERSKRIKARTPLEDDFKPRHLR